MTVIKSSVFQVLEKFPDRAGDIKRLYKESQEFQTVCEDYRLCAEACTTGINRMKKRRRPAERNMSSCFRS
jgi:hypothetical protein